MSNYDVDYYYKEELLTKIHVRGREVTFECFVNCFWCKN